MPCEIYIGQSSVMEHIDGSETTNIHSVCFAPIIRAHVLKNLRRVVFHIPLVPYQILNDYATSHLGFPETLRLAWLGLLGRIPGYPVTLEKECFFLLKNADKIPLGLFKFWLFITRLHQTNPLGFFWNKVLPPNPSPEEVYRFCLTLDITKRKLPAFMVVDKHTLWSGCEEDHATGFTPLEEVLKRLNNETYVENALLCKEFTRQRLTPKLLQIRERPMPEVKPHTVLAVLLEELQKDYEEVKKI